jgi:filamentous hemagglutinin
MSKFGKFGKPVGGGSKANFAPRGGGMPLTRSQARDLAKYHGFREVKGSPFNSHGQPVFTDGKKFYTPDVDGHRGGVWKVFDKKYNRIGTVDVNLKPVGD